jgi:hypothetical protein
MPKPNNTKCHADILKSVPPTGHASNVTSRGSISISIFYEMAYMLTPHIHVFNIQHPDERRPNSLMTIYEGQYEILFVLGIVT